MPVAEPAVAAEVVELGEENVGGVVGATALIAALASATPALIPSRIARVRS